MKELAKNIRTAEYNYDLQSSHIAKYPLPNRDQSKLLVYENGGISDSFFSKLPTLLPIDSVVIRNNSKVIQARIEFTKSTGARIEIFCLEPASPADYESNLSQKGSATWYCLIGNAKK